MKLIKLTSKNKDWSFICLESKDDLVKYQAINEQVKSKQAVDFWFGFKSHKFRNSPTSYAQHELESNNTIGLPLAIKMDLSEKPTSIIDFCSMADNIINDMHSCMFKYIDIGEMVRINYMGGYCPIDNLNEYHTVIDINEQEMYNFIVCGDIKSVFEINSDTIVIENNKYIPEELVNKFNEFTSIPKNNIQVITSFKSKSLLFKDEDYIKFFNDGIIKHNLKNIVFETTAQDTRQIDGIKKVFEYLMSKHTNRILTIYVKTYHKELFKTKSNNINIIFLK